MIGGALARPCISYPGLFPAGSIWDKYPYLLPNLFSAFIVVVGVVNGILFLEETHPEKKLRRDRGLELGNWILSKLPIFRKCAESRDEKSKLAEMETQPLIDHDEQLPGYQTNENSPENSPRIRSASVPSISWDSLDLESGHGNSNLGVSRIFTRPVVLNIISFGILALYVYYFYHVREIHCN